MKKVLCFVAACAISTASLFAQDGEVVWGGPENPNSTFDGGLNDWTTEGITDEDAVWVWEADGEADLGAYSGGNGPIQSPSVDNGAMVFDSDFYDNGGVQGDFGLGVAPAPATGELVSPIIDLTGVGTMSLRFNQYHRNFQSDCYVAWSMDGGETWSPNILLNDDVPLNEATPADDVATVPLFGATGTDMFRVKFIMDGNYYFWTVDDVQIIRRERNDMQVNENFYAIAPNYATPASQVEEFGFLVDITNNGGIEQTNVEVNMTIENESGDEVYTFDQAYGSVGDSVFQNVSFGDFLPPADANVEYTATYTVSSDSVDVDPSNNSISFDFMISDTVFAKESGATRDIFPAASNWADGESRSWAYGNHYHVVNGEGYYANTISFGLDVDVSAAEKIVDLRLYEWEDADENRSVGTDERTLVGFGLYEVTGLESFSGDIITIPLFSPTQDSPELKDNTSYIAVIEYRAELGDEDSDVRFAVSDARNYDAMILNSAQQDRLRVASVLGIAGDIDAEEYSWLGFGRQFAPVVRLNVTDTPLLSSDNNILLPETALNVTPNPAVDVMNANLAFDEQADYVSLRLLDVKGSVVLTRQLKNVITSNETFDISNLSAGNYFLHVHTDKGQLTRKVIVK